MANNLSVWLVPGPTSPAAALFSTLVLDLAERHGTEAFAPHVTLVGAVEVASPDAFEPIWEAIVRHARAQGPLDVPLSGVEAGALFYRCVYARVGPHPVLEALNASAQELIAALRPKEPFMGHLSLIYSDMPHAQRLEVCAEASALIRNEVAHVALSRVQLWDTTGPHEGWTMLAEADLEADE